MNRKQRRQQRQEEHAVDAAKNGRKAVVGMVAGLVALAIAIATGLTTPTTDHLIAELGARQQEARKQDAERALFLACARAGGVTARPEYPKGIFGPQDLVCLQRWHPETVEPMTTLHLGGAMTFEGNTAAPDANGDWVTIGPVGYGSGR